MSAENSTPQQAELERLDKLTKKSGDISITLILNSLSAASSWEVKWHALKAVKRCGVVNELVVNQLVEALDGIHRVPSGKQTYYERALDGALVQAGALISPHIDAIITRALENPDDSNLDDDADEEFERILTTASASRSALASVAKHITKEQADRCFDSLRSAATAGERAAAVEVCTTALKRFASPHLDAIVAASRDEDEIVRATAADALERCAGLSFDYKRGAGYGVAQTRAEHQLITSRLLEMRTDSSKVVRENVSGALSILGYKEDGGADGVDRSPAKRTRLSQ